MSDPIHDGVNEVERRLKQATSRGTVTLTEYVAIVDEVADAWFCGRARLHEEVRVSLGHAFGIEAMSEEAPGPRR